MSDASDAKGQLAARGDWAIAPGGLFVGGPGSRDSIGISARTDVEAIGGWLQDYADRPNTHRTYTKECKRFYHWLICFGPGELRLMTAEHVRQFKEYLSNPPLDQIQPSRNVEENQGRYYPFRGRLSETSIGIAFGTVGSLFMHLVQANYLPHSPFQLSNVKIARSLPAKVERFLSENLMEELLKTIQVMPEDSKYLVTVKRRAEMIVTLAYSTMARVGDIARHTMGSFTRVQRVSGVQWWWNVKGKGGKSARIPVSDEAMEALANYRRALGMEPYPRSWETAPIAISTRGSYQAMTENGIYRLIVDLSGKTADRLAAEGRDTEADVIRRMTTHWLRHSAITHAIDRNAPLIQVMATARHTDMNTTRRYMHADADEQHATMTRTLGLRRRQKNDE